MLFRSEEKWVTWVLRRPGGISHDGACRLRPGKRMTSVLCEYLCRWCTFDFTNSPPCPSSSRSQANLTSSSLTSHLIFLDEFTWIPNDQSSVSQLFNNEKRQRFLSERGRIECGAQDNNRYFVFANSIDKLRARKARKCLSFPSVAHGGKNYLLPAARYYRSFGGY